MQSLSLNAETSAGIFGADLAAIHSCFLLRDAELRVRFLCLSISWQKLTVPTLESQLTILFHSFINTAIFVY